MKGLLTIGLVHFFIRAIACGLLRHLPNSNVAKTDKTGGDSKGEFQRILLDTYIANTKMPGTHGNEDSRFPCTKMLFVPLLIIPITIVPVATTSIVKNISPYRNRSPQCSGPLTSGKQAPLLGSYIWPPRGRISQKYGRLIHKG